MATYESFEELQAWQKARELVNEIYSVSKHGMFARIFRYAIRSEKPVFLLFRTSRRVSIEVGQPSSFSFCPSPKGLLEK